MDDESAAIRSIIARSFALLAAGEHANDPEDHIAVAHRFSEWILGHEVFFGPAEEARKMMEGCLTKARASNKKKGSK